MDRVWGRGLGREEKGHKKEEEDGGGGEEDQFVARIPWALTMCQPRSGALVTNVDTCPGLTIWGRGTDTVQLSTITN